MAKALASELNGKVRDFDEIGDDDIFDGIQMTECMKKENLDPNLMKGDRLKREFTSPEFGPSNTESTQFVKRPLR